MKVYWHEKYDERYSSDPAAAPGRMDTMVAMARARHEVAAPGPATEEDVLLVHSAHHLDDIRSSRRLYPVAMLAVGGAIAASESAMRGEPAFGLIRPPGHHASPDSCWGFCYLNNMAIAIARLLSRGSIGSAFILDFDLHHGDGTDNAFGGDRRVRYRHPEAGDRVSFVRAVGEEIAAAPDYDVFAVSAGFDRAAGDWGGMLHLHDYREIGRMARDAAIAGCRGRRFGILEGGYNHEGLGDCLAAFLEGFDD